MEIVLNHQLLAKLVESTLIAIIANSDDFPNVFLHLVLR